jgi:hypothetical protein
LRKSSYKVQIQSISGSAAAIGNKPKAINKVASSEVSQESLHKAIVQADKLIECLTTHKDQVDNPDATLASAVKLREKLGRKKINLNSVRSALEQIGEAVAGVSVLAEVVARLQVLISHLMS